MHFLHQCRVERHHLVLAHPIGSRYLTPFRRKISQPTVSYSQKKPAFLPFSAPIWSHCGTQGVQSQSSPSTNRPIVKYYSLGGTNYADNAWP